MEPTLDLATLLNQRRLHENFKSSPARRKEKLRRQNKAVGMARIALTKAHPEQYADLYNQAKAMLDAESAPLPD